jgi:hypothetical protein
MSKGSGALLAIALAAGSACRSASDAAPTPRVETSASEAEAVLAPAVECQRILRRSWSAIQPALLRLRIPPQTLERDYLGSLGSAFVESCSSLDPAQRRCLARAQSPPLAIETCTMNRERSLADRVLLPSLAAHVTLTDPPPLARGEAERVIASLSGSWINVGTDGQTNATWSFGPGLRLHIRERKAGTESEETFRMSPRARQRLTLERRGGERQDIVIFRSRDALYVSRGLSYDAVPLNDRSRITLRHEASYVFFDPDGCALVTESGALFPAACSFERRSDGGEAFQVRQSAPPAPGLPVSYPIVDGHLLHERLASHGRFVRQQEKR